jgi:sucrose-6-phosphate hydrolase SacC (GH32 family)
MKISYRQILAVFLCVVCLFTAAYAFNTYVGIKDFFFSFGKRAYLVYVGDWDARISKTGNAVFDPETEQYLLYYSAHSGAAGDEKSIFTGVAESADLHNWHKLGKVFEEYAEDPFVIRCQDYFWMFYEGKSSGSSDAFINIARSVDGRHFEPAISGGIFKAADSSQPQSIFSPVAICTPEGAMVFFEVPNTGSGGSSIGYAYTTDFIQWRSFGLPVFSPPKGHFAVPQDITLLDDGRFVMTYSDVDDLFSFGRTAWRSKSIESRDLASWKESEYVRNRHEHSMFFGSHILMTSDSKGVYAFPLELYEW